MLSLLALADRLCSQCRPAHRRALIGDGAPDRRLRRDTHSVTTSALAALAEDPELHVEPAEGAQRVLDARSCVVLGPGRRWAGVCRLRLPDDEGSLVAAVVAVRRLTRGCR